VPSRKQRRRREKLQRHEWEYVRETEDGEEVVERPVARAGTKEPAKPQGPIDRRGRPIPKPSWRRVVKRTAIFAPLILAVVFLLGGNEVSTGAKVYNAIVLIAFFMPFSYMVDVLMYRMMSRRSQRPPDKS